MGYRDLYGFERYPRSRPRRVEGGIKARAQRGSIGETWWSQRFIAILESLGVGARLSRGRAYARRGQVLELKVVAGEVTAMVQGSRVKPYRVRLGVKTLSERDWTRAEKAMASQAFFVAKLLAGEMPLEIEEAFGACRLSLFPTARRELVSSCSCPDWANPCKHVAAAFYILAEAFDSDPFLIFTWRGRTKDELIERLRALRGTPQTLASHGTPQRRGWHVPRPAPGPAGPSRGSRGAVAPGASSGRSRMVHPAQSITEDEAVLSLQECLENFWEADSALGTLRVRTPAAAVPDALLREFGPAPLDVAGTNLAELLAPAYQIMSAAAERRALGDGSS